MDEDKVTTFSARIPSQPLFIVTIDPANVEHILKVNFENYVKGEYFTERVSDVLGTGIFAVDGDKWYSQRKITSTLFNVRNFETNMTDVFQTHGRELVSILDASLGTPIDAQNIFHRFTLDSIGDIAFGRNIGSLKDEHNAFAAAWDRTNEHIVFRFFSPIRALMPYSAGGKKIKVDIPFIKEFASEIVRDRRAAIRDGSAADKADLLTLMLNRRDENGNEFTDDFLTDMVLNIILAGRDTTAQSLTWTIMLLAQHPEVCARLRAEVDDVVGDDIPSFRDVQAMDYMYAVISESVRLYPSVPRDPKIARKQDTLPDGTVVPAGAAVVYFPYGMGRCTDIWGPDARSFKPERFLREEDGGIKRVKPSAYKFSAFQAGPRTCLGQNMAYLEESMVLAMVLQRYTFELVPGQKFKIRLNLTSPMDNGLNVVFKHRTDKKIAPLSH